MTRVHFGCFLVFAALSVVGCGGSPASSAKSPKVQQAGAPKVKPKTRVSNRPGNIEGSVLIVEYHKIAKEEARWDR